MRPPAPLPAGVKLVPNVEYANVDGKSLLLDLYLPEVIDKPVPIVVFIHGGAWSAGDKGNPPGIPLVTHGYALVSIDYRLSQEAVFPAQIHDCKAAIRWVRAHAKFYGMDGSRIAAWGSSAGGHLVALLGTSGGVKELEGDEGNLDQSSRVQAVCDWFGPTDFLKFAEQSTAAGIQSKVDPNSEKSALGRLLGGPVQENKDKAALANPITFVTKDCPPFLIMHGSKDMLVPVAQSEILRDALQKAGVDVNLKIIPGAGHGFGGPEISRAVFEFFEKNLKSAKPTTDQAEGGKK